MSERILSIPREDGDPIEIELDPSAPEKLVAQLAEHTDIVMTVEEAEIFIAEAIATPCPCCEAEKTNRQMRRALRKGRPNRRPR